MRRRRIVAVIVAVLPLSACASARSAPATPPPAAGGATPGAGAQQPPAGAQTPGGAAPGRQAGIRPYDQVVTREAVTRDGLFRVHRIADRLLFEIPDTLFGRDMLLISRVAGTPSGLNQAIPAGTSVAEHLIRWERQGTRVLLRTPSTVNIADDTLPIALSVRSNNYAPVLHSFAVQALGPGERTVVVDVTDLFRGDVQAISGLSPGQRTQYRVRRLDPDRTFIENARSFPLNVEVRHTLTFDAAEPPGAARTSTLSLLMNQSIVLLPKEPMRPRFNDARVGYFSYEYVNFGLEDEQKAATQRVIRRWRLEPKDPAAYARGELVEPVKPIVYYIDPGTPARWRQWIKQGVEDWQPAFETAGFRNAIIAKDPPSPREDPDFEPEDVRYSMVRYVANLTRNAMGPSVSDPRSGEIIASDILWFHNHLRSYRNRLIIETGAANPAARTLDLDDEQIGEAVRQVIAHEIGHALGFPHNMIGSSSYPVDSLRSPTFTARYGVSPSVMDYARQNYVAQPGDNVARFIRKIGPYDHYAVNWGYRVLPQAKTPAEEKAILDKWILERAHDPMYRFGPGSSTDPRDQTEDIGDDPVRASTYGIQNLKRVAPKLVEWTTAPGRDYTDLSELYDELISSWNRYIGHTITLVGGVYQHRRTADQPGPVFERVAADRQRAAMRFLDAQVFTTPTWLQDENILRRIEGGGALERIRRAQVSVVNRLLDAQRMQRLIEAETFAPRQAYTLAEMMGDLKRSIWSELEAGRAIDTYRRNLQRGHLDRLAFLVNDPPPATPAQGGGGPGGPGGPGGGGAATTAPVGQTDIRPLARAQLRELRAEAARAATRTNDTMTRHHLADVVARIDALLQPR